MIRRLYFSVLFILWYFIGYSQIEGVLQTTDYSTNFNGKYPEQRKNKIWFKDSSVIYESRLEMNSYGSIAEGTIVKAGYPVSAYFYLDLRTMMCQQYDDFRDTAMPMYNFPLKNEDGVTFWRLFPSKNAQQDKTQKITALADTTIENILYKRIKLEYKNSTENSYTIYYLRCNTQQNIVHMNPVLEQLYPGCKAFRNDFVYGGKQVARRFEYKIISDTLTETEKHIFENWGNNAKNTKLPVVSFNETKRGFSDHLKFDEKPIITILPDDSTFLKPPAITKITHDDVERWLHKNKNPSTPRKNTLIEKVLQNAVFDKMYVEILHEHEKENLIIVPLKNNHFSQHASLKKPPLQYLILVENEKGEILTSDIILFYPDKLLKTLPKNSFYNLFNSEFNSEDGTYALITLGDVKQWEMDFKNHQKTEFRVWMSERKNSKESTYCRAWYLDITRYFNWNIQNEKKYVGNTCTGCPPNQLCDKPGSADSVN